MTRGRLVKYAPDLTRVFLANENLAGQAKNLLSKQLAIPPSVVEGVSDFVGNYVDQVWLYKHNARPAAKKALSTGDCSKKRHRWTLGPSRPRSPLGTVRASDGGTSAARGGCQMGEPAERCSGPASGHWHRLFGARQRPPIWGAIRPRLLSPWPRYSQKYRSHTLMRGIA